MVVLDYGAPTKRRGGVYRPPQGNQLDPVYARFKQGLAALAQRRPPLWAQGLVEGCWVLEIDTRQAPLLLRQWIRWQTSICMLLRERNCWEVSSSQHWRVGHGL